MSADYIEAPPTGDILASYANDNLRLLDVLGELVDNALDANARTIAIQVAEQNKRGGHKWISVEDDGVGCEDLVHMVVLGKHHDSKSNDAGTLGRYGIGAKNAALWLGGVNSLIKIGSVYGGQFRSLEMRWREYGKEWRIPNDWRTAGPAEPGEKGTAIHIEPCVRTISEKRRASLVDELSYVYYPAIRHGVSITLEVHSKSGVKAFPLRPWVMPPLAHEVKETKDLGGDRKFILHAGMPPDNIGSRWGLTFTHGLRVILSKSGIGCDGRHSRICGTVDLIGSGWQLTKNKNDLHSQDREILNEALRPLLADLLAAAENRAEHVEFADLSQKVTDLMRGMLISSFGEPDSKAKRGTGNKRGTVPPGDGKKKHNRAKNSQRGQTFSEVAQKYSNRLRVEYRDFDDPEKLGEFSDGAVVMNSGHFFIKKAKQEQNALAIAVAAATIFAACPTQAQVNMWQSSSDVLDGVGKLLSGYRQEEASHEAEAAE